MMASKNVFALQNLKSDPSYLTSKLTEICSSVSQDVWRSEVGRPQVPAGPESSLLHQRHPPQPAQGTREDGAPEGHRCSRR